MRWTIGSTWQSSASPERENRGRPGPTWRSGGRSGPRGTDTWWRPQPDRGSGSMSARNGRVWGAGAAAAARARPGVRERVRLERTPSVAAADLEVRRSVRPERTRIAGSSSAGVEEPCTHGSIRTHLASAKWDETCVVARASVSQQAGQRCSPPWSRRDSLFSSRVFTWSTTLGAAASVGSSSHKTHERKRRYAAGARRRVSFPARHGHRRPCDHASLVLLRRRGMSVYVPVRAGPWTRPRCPHCPGCPSRRDIRCSPGIRHPGTKAPGQQTQPGEHPQLRHESGRGRCDVRVRRTRAGGAGVAGVSVGGGHASGAAGRTGVESPCTHGNIRTRLASAKWDETPVVARASVVVSRWERHSPSWLGRVSFFLSMVLWEELPTEAAAPRVVDP
jgi:hypothetical protein